MLVPKCISGLRLPVLDFFCADFDSASGSVLFLIHMLPPVFSSFAGFQNFYTQTLTARCDIPYTLNLLRCFRNPRNAPFVFPRIARVPAGHRLFFHPVVINSAQLFTDGLHLFSVLSLWFFCVKQIGTMPKRTVIFQVFRRLPWVPVAEQCIGKYNRLDVSGVEIIFLCAVVLLRNLLKRLRFKEQRCGVLVGSLLLLIFPSPVARKIRRRIPARHLPPAVSFSPPLSLTAGPGFFPVSLFSGAVASSTHNQKQPPVDTAAFPALYTPGRMTGKS